MFEAEFEQLNTGGRVRFGYPFTIFCKGCLLSDHIVLDGVFTTVLGLVCKVVNLFQCF